jgi:hypothetical protein
MVVKRVYHHDQPFGRLTMTNSDGRLIFSSALPPNGTITVLGHDETTDVSGELKRASYTAQSTQLQRRMDWGEGKLNSCSSRSHCEEANRSPSITRGVKMRIEPSSTPHDSSGASSQAYTTNFGFRRIQRARCHRYSSPRYARIELPSRPWTDRFAWHISLACLNLEGMAERLISNSTGTSTYLLYIQPPLLHAHIDAVRHMGPPYIRSLRVPDDMCVVDSLFVLSYYGHFLRCLLLVLFLQPTVYRHHFSHQTVFALL